MTTYVFTITSLETGRAIGAAVVAPQARYAAIAWRHQERFERRWVPAVGWLAVERQVAEQLEPGPLAQTSALVNALQLRNDQVLQYQSVEPIGGDGIVQVETFDARLRAAAAAAFGVRMEIVR